MPQAQQLGRYQLLDRIAFGGMAEIYRAKTFDSERRVRLVAVKRVLQHLTSDEDFIRMLVDEAKITAILDHPAIARVYEFSQAGEEYFIAMEYVDGKDARAILEKHRALKLPIPPEHVAWIIAHTAEGLHAAHAQVDVDGTPMNIVHRDVSPSNVLCSYQGDVKLCDFGIAKASLTRVQTRTGVIKGKVKYMSPEQAMGRKLDGRSDLFSLGTVMYELLTLEAPFMAATEVELIFTVRDARKRSAREVMPTLPEAIEVILDRVMQRQRADLFQTGKELGRELFGYIAKHHPGYGRAQFSRFMRALFKDEIEKELRLLESWTLDSVDPSRVGVNLIADALPEDAPYRGFSASSEDLADLLAHARPKQDSVGDMPAAATAIYRNEAHLPPGVVRARQAEQEVSDLHAAATMMLEGRAAEALLSRLRDGAPPSTNLHEQDTHIIQVPAPPAADAATKSAETKSAETDLPAIATVIVSSQSFQAVLPPPPPAPRSKQDTTPDPAPDEISNEVTEPTSPSVLVSHPDFDDDDDADTNRHKRGPKPT